MAQSLATDKSAHTRAPEGGAALRTRRELNVGLVLGTLITLAVVVAAASLWRSLQVSREADVLKQRGQELAEQGSFGKAAAYYFRFLKLRPDDADVPVLLAEAFDRASGGGMEQKFHAIDYYYEALGKAPPEKQLSLRCRLAELLVDAGANRPTDYRRAEDVAEEILADGTCWPARCTAKFLRGARARANATNIRSVLPLRKR